MKELMFVIVMASMVLFLASGAAVLCCLAARLLGFGVQAKIAAVQMKRMTDAETARSERETAGRINLA